MEYYQHYQTVDWPVQQAPIPLYLDSVPVKTDGNQPLSKVIKLQIVKCRSSYSGITVPLEEAITTQSYQVEQLLTDLNLLNAYLEADMMSRLNLVITFTDNDGD